MSRRRQWARTIGALLLPWAPVSVASGCGGEALVGASYGTTDAGEGGLAQEAGACFVTACAGVVLACGDCIDNDADARVDAADPGCVGPCDDDEATLGTGLRGVNEANCRQDCFFDANLGHGDDGCFWSHACDPLSQAPGFPPSGDPACAHSPEVSVPGARAGCSGLMQSQEPRCLDACLPLLPNGCDCFGCCELPARSGRTVWLGSSSGGVPTCTLETLDDPLRCRPCTQVPSCLNPCDDCETCAGGAAPRVACEAGNGCGAAAACDGNDSCPAGTYCVTGCCVDVPR